MMLEGNEKYILSEKEQKILDILQSAKDALTFTEILEKYPYSKGTFNRYLNSLVERGLLLKLKDKDHTRAKYRVQLPNTIINPLIPLPGTKMISFFEEFGVPEDFLPDMALLLSYMGDKFIELEQSPELYLAFFYVYQNCTWVNRAIHINKKEFCASFVRAFPQLTSISLEYHVNKLVTKDLGLVRVSFEIWDYFFHVKDEFGRALRSCVQEKLQKFVFDSEMAPIIQKLRPRELHDASAPEMESIPSLKKLDLGEMTEIVLRWLVDHQFLPENLRDAFYTAVNNIILDCTIELRIPPKYLPTEVTQKTPAGIQTEKIRGFCGTCGEWITWGEQMCSYCRAPVDQDSLIADCVEARQRRRQYREEIGETTFPCPHCGFVLQKAWQEKQCPSCKKDLPDDSAKLVKKSNEEKEESSKKSQEEQVTIESKRNYREKKEDVKNKIAPREAGEGHQKNEENIPVVKKKISPQLQEILNQPIEKSQEIQAWEEIREPTPPETIDFITKWGFDPVKNKTILASGYFYKGESINLENIKWEIRTLRICPYVYAYPNYPSGVDHSDHNPQYFLFEGGEKPIITPRKQYPQSDDTFRYLMIEQGEKQIPIPFPLGLLAGFNHIQKIDDPTVDTYTPWRQFVVLREIVKDIATWDIWGEQFPLDWIPKVRIYGAGLANEFPFFYSRLVNAIIQLVQPIGFDPQELFLYHHLSLTHPTVDSDFRLMKWFPQKKGGDIIDDEELEMQLHIPRLGIPPINKDQILTMEKLVDFEWKEKTLNRFENCLVNTPLLLRIVEVSHGGVLFERMQENIPEAVHFLEHSAFPDENEEEEEEIESDRDEEEELYECVEDPIGTKSGYRWWGSFYQYWSLYHSVIWRILMINTKENSFSQRLLELIPNESEQKSIKEPVRKNRNPKKPMH